MTGPQKRLTQYTGVAITTTTGRPASRAAATVVWWSSGSGMGWVPSLPARESMPPRGTSGGEPMVRFWERGAGSPTPGTRWRSRTAKAPVPLWSSPSTATVTSARQNPALSKPTEAA